MALATIFTINFPRDRINVKLATITKILIYTLK